MSNKNRNLREHNGNVKNKTIDLQPQQASPVQTTQTAESFREQGQQGEEGKSWAPKAQICA